jgi:hypothetical protein
MIPLSLVMPQQKAGYIWLIHDICIPPNMTVNPIHMYD